MFAIIKPVLILAALIFAFTAYNLDPEAARQTIRKTLVRIDYRTRQLGEFMHEVMED